jgi:hypothetical protein
VDRLPVFLEKPARCEVHGDTVHFIWEGHHSVMPISVYMANVRGVQEALAKRQVEQLGKVTSLHEH